MSRRPKYTPKPFETKRKARASRSEAFASLYHSMMTSPAYVALTPRQRDLYTFCKLQYYGETPRGNPEFTMNQYKWCQKYKIYSRGNASSFYRDMEALITHGFIDCIQQGALTKRKNIYRLSDRWRYYDTDRFEVPLSCMTAGMLRRVCELK